MKIIRIATNPYMWITLFTTLALIIVPFWSFGEWANNSTPYPTELYAMCFDGIDNDGDGFTDYNDPDCPRCYDGIDNDGDGLVDLADPDCPNYAGQVLGASTSRADRDTIDHNFDDRDNDRNGDIVGCKYDAEDPDDCVIGGFGSVGGGRVLGASTSRADRDRRDPLQVLCKVSDRDIVIGEKMTFRADIDGGEKPYIIDWEGDIEGNDEREDVRFYEEDEYEVEVFVRDSNGVTDRASCSTVTVSESKVTRNGGSVGTNGEYIGGGKIIGDGKIVY